MIDATETGESRSNASSDVFILGTVVAQELAATTLTQAGTSAFPLQKEPAPGPLLLLLDSR